MRKIVRPWHKASASSNDGTHCVEVQHYDDGGVSIRDSKDKGKGPVLEFTKEEWAAFQDGMAKGEFTV